jgi:uncharacterized protein YfaS (alpha-2-macroglobulin family)
MMTVVFLVALAAAGILLEKPKGSIEGILLLESGYENYVTVYSADNVKEANARVIAYGEVVRGAYVNTEGKFRIDGLPVGKYRLQYKAEGYSSETKWGIEVKENTIKELKVEKLNFMTPSLDLASDTKVFMPQEYPSLWYSSSAIKEVEFKLYKFDPLKELENTDVNRDDLGSFLLGNYYYGNDNFADTIIKGKEPVKTWKQKVEYGAEDYARNNIKLESRLDSGSYLLFAEGVPFKKESVKSDFFWFSVTDLGLIAKQDPEKILFRTVNLETLEATAGATVRIYDRENNYKILDEVKTNDKGIAEYTFDKDYNRDYSSLLVLAMSADNLALNGSYSWYYSDDKYKVYLYTDRPVYRPDQTVYFKGIVRTVDKNGIKNSVNQAVDVAIYSPDDQPLSKMKLQSSKYGTYHGLLELPKDAMLGNYRITTKIDDFSTDNYFEVSEYRKPEYKVDVIPASDILIGGSKARATIKANYYFGYPVTGAKVKYTVYAAPDYSLKWDLITRPDYYSFYDDWDDDDAYYYTGRDYGNSTGEIIAEGYGTTDENGEAKVTFDTKQVKVNNDDFYGYYDGMAQKYWIEAEVTDISRKTSTGKGKFNVVAGEYALFTDTDYYVYTEDQDIRVTVQAVGYDKNPVQTKVKLQLQQWSWNSENWEYTDPTVTSTTEVVTDKNGEGIGVLEIPDKSPTRNYRIVAYGTDSQGNTITSSSYVWISNFGDRYAKAEVKPKLQLTLDKKVYQPGDTAKIMIVSPVKPQQGMQALVSVEGNVLYNYKLVDITSQAQMITLPVESKYMPNAYVSVSLVGPKKQFYQDTKMLKVSPNNNFLNIDIQSNKDRYMPQDTVDYTIRVTDHKGSPVQAELSVGVVDESIYAIREDFTPDIKKFFYARNANLVQTTYSFYSSYSAGADKIQPRLRKDFKDTAYWNATVKTGADGIGKVKFKLPDNLTTWRTTVRAVTPDTKVASAIDNILVTKDVIVRLALPRFYTVGDKATLATIVHNYTDKEQNLQLKINLPSNFSKIKKSDMMVQVPSMDKYRKDWEIEAEVAGKAKVQAYALSATIEGDAIEQDIEILPYGVAKAEIVGGKTSEEQLSVPIEGNITESIVPGSLSWTIRLTASPAGMLLGSLDYLIDYPYGCVEQTMSKFLPSIIAGNISKTLGVSLNEKTRKKLPDVIKDSQERLYKMQHDDGGWGWWEHDQSDPYMTAYVLYGLYYAKLSNYKVEQSRIDRALSWLEKYLNSKEASKELEARTDKINSSYDSSGESLTDLCYENYVLTLYGKRNNKMLEGLYKNSENIQSPGVAYLSLAFSNLGKQSYAETLVNQLMGRVDINAPVISYGILKHLGWNYNYNIPENTAIVLRAIIKVKPDAPLVESMVQYLVDSREGNYWNNTKTTSKVVLALSEYLKVKIQEDMPDYEVVVRINGDVVETLRFNDTNVFDQEVILSIPEKFISESNTVTLEKSGTGDMYYTSEFKYYRLYKPDQIIPATTENGVHITKELYRLKSKTDKYGNITYEEVPLRGAIQAGEVLLVKLIIVTKKHGEYIMIEDPKASSMELISTDPREKLGRSYDSEDNTYWWDYWWTHQEDKDTHMAFFITTLKPGTYEVKYLVRPEFPGSYLMRPTVLEGMYTDVVSGSSVSSKLSVEE